MAISRYLSRILFCIHHSHTNKDALILIKLTTLFIFGKRFPILGIDIKSLSINLINIKFDNKFYSINLRIQDMPIFFEVWQFPTYKINSKYKPELIYDIGAHIGMATLYFHHYHPYTKIIAIEPSPENFKILKINTKNIPQIQPQQAAVTDSDKTVYLDEHPIGYNAVIADKLTSVKVEGYSMLSLFSQFNIPTSINAIVVKMDIEGEEYSIFKTNTQWLNVIDWLLIETHGKNMDLFIRNIMVHNDFMLKEKRKAVCVYRKKHSGDFESINHFKL